MASPRPARLFVAPLTAIAVLLGSTALAGCSGGRDEILAEKLAAAEAAARRAERAARQAEAAAAKLGVQPVAAPTEEAEDITDENEDGDDVDVNPEPPRTEAVAEASPQPAPAG